MFAKKLVLLGLVFNINTFATEAVGFYSNGSLKDGVSIIDRNIDVQKLFISRKKLFATEELLELIDEASLFLKTNFKSAEPLALGDLAAVNGGKAARHASHQNGLDADIVYLKVNEKPQDSNNPEWAENFVTKNGVSKNFHTARNFELLKYLASKDNVERIFVDTLIKKELCMFVNITENAKTLSNLEFLRKLRPANLHQTHFHVRIACPKTDLNCISQAAPPAGSGCSAVDLQIMDELSFNP